MKYTKWLIENYPELEAESSVIIFNYVRQAKSDTKPQRMLTGFLYFITMMLFACFLGYFLGRFTEVKVGITMAIAIGISILVSWAIEKRNQKIIQKKLIELVGKNT
jgi:lipopolysaccharide export LptBFGC system permease protein LptF